MRSGPADGPRRPGQRRGGARHATRGEHVPPVSGPELLAPTEQPLPPQYATRSDPRYDAPAEPPAPPAAPPPAYQQGWDPAAGLPHPYAVRPPEQQSAGYQQYAYRPYQDDTPVAGVSLFGVPIGPSQQQPAPVPPGYEPAPQYPPRAYQRPEPQFPPQFPPQYPPQQHTPSPSSPSSPPVPFEPPRPRAPRSPAPSGGFAGPSVDEDYVPASRRSAVGEDAGPFAPDRAGAPVGSLLGGSAGGAGTATGLPSRRVVREKHQAARRKARRRMIGGSFGAVIEVIVVVTLALGLALVVKTFLVQAFYIPSESMERTLMVGDRVLVSKLTPGPLALHHGDVVVFKDPGGWLRPQPVPQEGAVRQGVRKALTFVGLLPQDSGEHLIKRLIGLPGDTVQCCDAKGRIMVNGVPVDEPYLQPGIEPSTLRFKVKVPAGRLWVMGDNRPFSEDSRYHPNLDGGTVPVDDVVGKAFVVVWPLSRAGGLGIPDSVFADVPSSSGEP